MVTNQGVHNETLSLAPPPVLCEQAAGQVRGGVPSHAERGQRNRTVGGDILRGLPMPASSGDKGDPLMSRRAEQVAMLGALDEVGLCF